MIGLNIGSKTIKAIEVKNNRGTLQVLGAGIRPTPEGVISNGIIVDPGLLGESIKELLQECGIRGKKVVSSVAGQQSLVVRIIEVPRMTQAELAETMKWEIERHIPFPAEDVVMDFRPLPKPESNGGGGEEEAEGETMEVLLAVAQEEMINAHVETLEKAGLAPQAVDIEPLALARTLAVYEDEGLDEGKTVALINVGARSTEISVVDDFELTFTRTVPLGGENLTLAISESLGLQPDEAERAKIEMGSALLTESYDQGVDSMTEMQVGGEDNPFESFDVETAAAEEPAAAAPDETETTDGGAEFDLSFDATETDTGTNLEVPAAETAGDTTGDELSFDLSLDTLETTDDAAAAAVADTEETVSLDFDLGADNIDLVAEPEAPAAEPAPEEDDVPGLELSLDLGAEEAAAEPEPPANLEATLSLEPVADQPPEEEPLALSLDQGESEPESPASLELDLGAEAEPADEAAAEEETAGSAFELDLGGDAAAGDASTAFELDLGDETPAAAPAAEEDSPGAFELDLGPEAPAAESPAPEASEESPLSFALDLGGAETETEPGTEAGDAAADASGMFDPSADLSGEGGEGGGEEFSFRLEEPSDEGASPAAVAAVEEDQQAGLPTEEDDEGGLMDLDELDSLSELGTMGGEVTEDSVYAALSPVIGELITETRRSLEYYTSRYQGASIDKVLLSGGAAKLRSLADVLAGELGVAVEVANPFQYLEVSEKNDLTPEFLGEIASDLTVGLGLAMRDMVQD